MQRCQATLFKRSRCIVHCRAIPEACPGASTLRFGGTALHRVGANFIPCPGCLVTPSSPHRPLAPGQVLPRRVAGAGVLRLGRGRLPPVYHPGVCVRRRCSDPSARCAVAVEIACAVARQLKHPCLHTAMPWNSQLSSFLSLFFDFADMTPLALIPLHSVALLQFLGVNPINPKKPAWHCKWDLWQWIQGWRS